MLSKNKKKFINSLFHKKYRKQFHSFIAEGHKLNYELLRSGMKCKELIATENWASENKNIIDKNISVTYAAETELKSISNFKSPPPVIGIYEIRDDKIKPEALSNQLTIALDEIQDPGNMGTIIRLSDWFGIRHIICSEGTADVYSPKVVQATMGALSRVNVHYTDLPKFINEYRHVTGLPVYGTFLEGENIYKKELTVNGMIVMGNEGKGISISIEELITEKLYIPNYPPDAPTSESLNVSVATAIICSEFRKRLM